MLCLVAGCDGAVYRKNTRLENFQATDADFRDLADSAFHLIDPKSHINTILVAQGIDPRAVVALRRVAKVIRASADAASGNALLPADVFVVQTFSIDDAVAMIEGQLGPVTLTMTAANLRDCGRIYTLPFFLESGNWVSHNYKVQRCDESRHWVPVDEVEAPAGP